jgi:UDP-N-acetylmuramoyl-L-alanyl-D-glutamate--2,6-diaminopimelate ligase
VNRDDPRADAVIRSTRARVITFGFSANADVRPAGPVSHGMNGLSFTAATPAGPIEIVSPLAGRHNISNILAAVGLGLGLGFTHDDIAAGICAMQAVPGRMERVDAGQPFGVFVDYAHTEDALVRLLEAVREVAAKRIITVFGCGGDRDRAKRPKMGAAAAKGSDLVIVTSDNPRSEDPLAIIREIESGMAVVGKAAYRVIPDRAAAIDAAIGAAQSGDIVVLAGKGHEDYQIVGDVKHHFDDREEARKAIAKRSAEFGARRAT